MKYIVTCQGCSRRFKIPDDVYTRRIQGRTLALRCRHCRTLIELDGDKLATIPPVDSRPSAKPTLPAPSESIPSLSVTLPSAVSPGAEDDDEVDLPTRIWRPPPIESKPPEIRSTIPPVFTPPRPMARPDSVPSERLAWADDTPTEDDATSETEDRDSKEVVHFPVPVPIATAALPNLAVNLIQPQEMSAASQRNMRRMLPIALLSALVLVAWVLFKPDSDKVEAVSAAAIAPKAPLARDAVNHAFDAAISEAARCGTPDGPKGTARVAIEMRAAAKAPDVMVVNAPFVGTDVANCITAALQKVSVPANDGESFSLDKTVIIR